MLWLHDIIDVILMARVTDLGHVLLLLVGPSRLAANVLNMVAVVVRKRTAQIHHLLLTCVLQQLRNAV